MYSVGDKLDLKDIDMFIEINSVYPGSQGMRLTIEGENYYGAVINGNKCYVGEKLIEWFHESIAKKKAVVEQVIKNIENPIEVKESVLVPHRTVKDIAEKAVEKLEAKSKKRVKK